MNHGGNIYQFARQVGCLPDQVLDFSANINPEQAVSADNLPVTALGPYADPDYPLLKAALTSRYPYPDGVDIEVFNGASAAIFAVLRWLQPQDVVLYTPLYGEYVQIAKQLGCTVHTVDRFTDVGAAVPKNSTVIFVNPATPDGQLYEMQTLLGRWRQAGCTVLVDESFLDFCPAESVSAYLGEDDKLLLVKSLSKFYGCAGIRIGFVLAATPVIRQLRRLEPAWKLSSFDMAYMQQALANTAFIDQTRQQTRQRRELLAQTLADSGLFTHIYPSQANFLLAELAADGDGQQLQARLATARILIRVCANFTGLTNRHVRFAVKDELAIAQLAKALQGGVS